MKAGREGGRIEGRMEGRMEGRIEGRTAGREEGRAAEQVTIIRNMAGKGLDPSAIADMLGLEEGYVKKVLYLLAEETGRTDLEIAGILLEQRQEG